MDQLILNSFITILLTAVITTLANYWLQNKFFKQRSKKDVTHDRLVHLLQPLYIKVMMEDTLFEVHQKSDKGNPTCFLDDLPKYYKQILKILKEYLYLADDELLNASIKFIFWMEIENVNNLRYDMVMTGNQRDYELIEFKKCVIRKYKEDIRQYLSF